jgi:hypothetical protein
MATYDFVHDEQCVDALIDRLEANLPATWLDAENTIMGLQRIEFGTLRSWRYTGQPGDEGPHDLLPCILCRFSTNEERVEYTTIGGKEGRWTSVTVVHLFGDPQCRDLTAPYRAIQAERAKAQRAKAISKAIWYHATDSVRRRLGGPTLTTSDTSAMVVTVVPGAILYDLPEDRIGEGLYAVGLTLGIATHTE